MPSQEEMGLFASWVYLSHSQCLFFFVATALKYTKVEQLSLRERLARINTHTLSKKTTRLSQLLKQEAGLVARVSLCSGGGRYWNESRMRYLWKAR